MEQYSDNYLIEGEGFGKCNRKQRFFLNEINSYNWLSHDGHKKIIFMNPYEHLESEQEIIDKKRYL